LCIGHIFDLVVAKALDELFVRWLMGYGCSGVRGFGSPEMAGFGMSQQIPKARCFHTPSLSSPEITPRSKLGA